LYAGWQERASRIGGICVAVLDLADKAVKINILARYHDNDVAGTKQLLIDRKFDNRGVAVFLGHRLVLKGVGIETKGLTKRNFHTSSFAEFGRIGNRPLTSVALSKSR